MTGFMGTGPLLASTHMGSLPSGNTGSSGYSGLANANSLAMGMQVAGVLTSAIGAFYSIKSAQYQAKSQAMNLEFQATMADMNARAAENDAQNILRAGQQQAGQVGLQYRQLKSATRARRGGAGIQSGVGSAAEIDASIDYAKETDIISINMNTVRAAKGRRMQGVGMQTQASMGRLSASNMLASARSMNPGLAGFTSLLGGATGVASTWAQSRRDEQRYRYQRGLS
mgnify:CR=1 FL=1